MKSVRLQSATRVRDCVTDLIWTQTGIQFNYQVNDEIWARVWEQVSNQIRYQIEAKLHEVS